MTKKQSAFLNQNEDVVDRSVIFYQKLMETNAQAISNLVGRLQNGERVPLPCSPDPNEACGIPISFPVQSPYKIGLSDVFKNGGSGRYYIAFTDPERDKSYIIWSFYVANIIYDDPIIKNVIEIQASKREGEVARVYTLDQVVNQWGVVALQY